MNRLIRKARVLLSYPFALLGIAFMGLAVWICPRHESRKP